MSGTGASPHDQVTFELWDVRYADGGFGKHGEGPFSTKAQAEASLRAVGRPGQVESVTVTMDREHAQARYPRVRMKFARGD